MSTCELCTVHILLPSVHFLCSKTLAYKYIKTRICRIIHTYACIFCRAQDYSIPHNKICNNTKKHELTVQETCFLNC